MANQTQRDILIIGTQLVVIKFNGLDGMSKVKLNSVVIVFPIVISASLLPGCN